MLCVFSSDALKADPAFKSAVEEEQNAYTKFRDEQRRRECELYKDQLKEREELLRKLFEINQAVQIKALTEAHERYVCTVRSFYGFLSFIQKSENVNRLVYTFVELIMFSTGLESFLKYTADGFCANGKRKHAFCTRSSLSPPSPNPFLLCVIFCPVPNFGLFVLVPALPTQHF